jgi:RNase H-fold protein (predicted Holliday junction resolvase)
MHTDFQVVTDQPVILGFDPGRQKCGVAVMGVDRSLRYNQVIESGQAVATVQQLCSAYPVTLIVIGDQTSSREWQQRLSHELTESLRVVAVDERNSTLEARDRYWQMYPPSGFSRLLPQSLRTIPRPIDDIVAILLIERYLAKLTTRPPEW